MIKVVLLLVLPRLLLLLWLFVIICLPAWHALLIGIILIAIIWCLVVPLAVALVELLGSVSLVGTWVIFRRWRLVTTALWSKRGGWRSEGCSWGCERGSRRCEWWSRWCEPSTLWLERLKFWSSQLWSGRGCGWCKRFWIKAFNFTGIKGETRFFCWSYLLDILTLSIGNLTWASSLVNTSNTCWACRCLLLFRLESWLWFLVKSIFNL